MRNLTNKFIEWCADTSPAARFERTIVQGVIGVGVGLLGIYATGEGVAGLIIAPLVMAILAPIQAQIGKANEGEE